MLKAEDRHVGEDVDLAAANASVLFRSLPRSEVEFLLGHGRSVAFDSSQTMFLQGDPARAFYIVLDGWVKLYRVDEHGQEAVVNVLSRGQSFGEAVALSGGVYPVSAEAVASCRVLELPAGLFITRMTEEPALAMALVSSVLRHLRQLVDEVEKLKARSAAQRVAAFLIELSEVEEGPFEVVLPYDKALVAGRLGIKPESLSRVFVRLREHGVTISRNRAHIRDVGDLRAFCERDRAESWQR